MNRRLALLPPVAAFALLARAEEAPPTREQLDFFEKKIRPVLAEKCYKCHSASAEKIRGGLLLDTREGIRRGGQNGPAVVPGDLEQSLLLEAIRYQNADFAMPPKSAGGKLPDAVIRDFEQWVKMGAPDPRQGRTQEAKTWNSEEARNWWAFQPPKKVPPPKPKDAAWARTDIDRFVRAAQEQKGLLPVADADKPTLLRRLYFDLIGLPPTPEEIQVFLRDNSPTALAKVADRLLDSPRFGERWARHWLDVARYAESTGKEINMAYPHAWRYRDYVIESFNQDKPYDQFLREQLAGDLLPAANEKQRAEQIVATGFLALGPKSLNEGNPRQFYLDLADEQIDAMSQAMLGMTLACARCHDHKFDPVSQREYYALAGIFLSSDTRFGTAAIQQNRHPTELIELPPGANAPVLAQSLPAAERARKQQERDQLQQEREELLKIALQERMAKRQEMVSDAEAARRQQDRQRLQNLNTRIALLESELKAFDENGRPRPLAMGVEELPPAAASAAGRRRGGGSKTLRMPQRYGARPPEFSRIGDSPLYVRGEPDKPAGRVPRGFPAALTQGTPPALPLTESGRRQLAGWVASAQNPLTARVMVNRIWYWLLGEGIVPTLDNFGNSGLPPSNQALLDDLAVRFMENGWSVKSLIREIVSSRVYQLSSTFDQKNFLVDPDNALLWRAHKRRLDAECIHDAMLAISGQLNLQPPVGSAVAWAGDGIIGGLRRTPAAGEETLRREAHTRSIYQALAREMLPDSLALFDFPDPSMVMGKRETTNVASQALYLLNSPFVTRQAEALAERLRKQFPAPPNSPATAQVEPRVTLAYQLVLGRLPTRAELNAATGFLLRFPTAWRKGDADVPRRGGEEHTRAAWTSFCRALFASAEFRYLN